MLDEHAVATVQTIAEEIKVPPAALLAVVDVESGGRVFARVNGKNEPLIRFEGHYFDRFLRGEPRIKARKAGLANPVPGRVRNGRSQASRWKKLDRAIDINRVAALSSCSWGVGQVMGAHWKWLGYGSVDALVAEARSGLAGQVRLMARYIDKANLIHALRSQNWRKFARVYNGPAFAKNQYDVKMAQAFDRYQRRYLPPQLPQPASANGTKLQFGLRGSAVKQAQKKLSALGYLIKADGMFGLMTDRTVRAFQRDHGLEETGIIGKAETLLLNSVQGPLPRIVAKTGIAAKRLGGSKMRQSTSKVLKKVGNKVRGFRKRLLSLSQRFA